jgi:NMD protein affecting ribosome stability and mRNA decay
MVRSIEDKHPLYFEAILQLREVSEKVVDYVLSEVHRVKLPVTKTTKVKNGWDYYMADNQFTKSLGKRLQQKFGGQLMMTASLHTKIKGKDVYRVTVLFRGIHFKKNDKIKYHGEDYDVLSVGKDIMLKDLKTGKKIHVKYDQVKKIKLI